MVVFAYRMFWSSILGRKSLDKNSGGPTSRKYAEKVCYDTRMSMDIMTKKNEVVKIAEKYGLDLVVLFGSQATGQTHKESDIDIAYSGNKRLTFDEEIRINSDLIDAFERDDVQLVNIKKASPLLMKQIVDHAVILYEREKSIFDSIFVLAQRMFEDARTLFDLRRHFLDYKLKEYKYA